MIIEPKNLYGVITVTNKELAVQGIGEKEKKVIEAMLIKTHVKPTLRKAQDDSQGGVWNDSRYIYIGDIEATDNYIISAYERPIYADEIEYAIVKRVDGVSRLLSFLPIRPER